MTLHNTNTIVLDKHTRIELAAMDGRRDRAVDVDPFLEPVAEFWISLQTVCTVNCCGVQALEFQPKQIAKVSKQNGSVIFDQLMELHGFVLTHESDTFVSYLLNQCFDCDQLIQILEHLVDHLSPDSFLTNETMTDKSRVRKFIEIETAIVTSVALAVTSFWPQWSLYVLLGIIAWVVFGFWMLLRDQ